LRLGKESFAQLDESIVKGNVDHALCTSSTRPGDSVTEQTFVKDREMSGVLRGARACHAAPARRHTARKQ
jgi:hypothetical protein